MPNKKNILVDVITMDAVPNYGSVLQAYATKIILEKVKCDVNIINYVREDVNYKNLVRTWSNGNIIKAVVIWPTIKKWKRVFGEFRRSELDIKEPSYTTESDFDLYPLLADAYCTGSDQVWNSVWNNGVISPLYLSFVPADKYKFSLSSSFGQNELSDKEVNETKGFLKEYKYISVREKDGLDILREQYGFSNTVQLVDPTLFLTAEEWREIYIKNINTTINEPYILIYNLNRSKEFDNYCVELSKKTGLRLVRLCTRYDQFYRPGKCIFIPGVFDFINLIDHAKYVITDSFHATAISLNLGVEPICVYPKQFGNRIESILDLTDTLHRHISDFADYDVVNRSVDFKKVKTILESEREKVNSYILKVISEIKD